MLTRVYVDNYKCLVNFEFKPKPLQLILGLNGAGKSTLIDILSLLRRFVFEGGTTMELFETRTLTRWQSLVVQTFELDVEGNGGQYRYRLEVEHDAPHKQCRAAGEGLTFDGKPLFVSNSGEGQLYRDDFSMGPPARFDWTRSGIGALSARPDNQKLTWFKQWMGRLFCIHPNPRGMLGRTDGEEAFPNQDLANFASWYRHLLQEKPDAIHALRTSLAQVIDCFDSLRHKNEGENVRDLRLTQKSDKSLKPISFEFDELSDGQRMLIALYTLLHCTEDEQATLCIDEPANFVALSEIQPWLLSVSDAVTRNKCQAILVSHHPEVIDFLAPDCGVVFHRPDIGPVQVRPVSSDASGVMKLSELIARGWTDE